MSILFMFPSNLLWFNNVKHKHVICVARWQICPASWGRCDSTGSSSQWLSAANWQQGAPIRINAGMASRNPGEEVGRLFKILHLRKANSSIVSPFSLSPSAAVLTKSKEHDRSWWLLRLNAAPWRWGNLLAGYWMRGRNKYILTSSIVSRYPSTSFHVN